MNKRILILILSLMMAYNANAQIFVMEDEANPRLNIDADEPFILNSGGLEYDQTNYTPIGSGVLLLTALGGAYALAKKKEK